MRYPVLIYLPVQKYPSQVTVSRFIHHPVRKLPTILLYHSQMLHILVRLKQQLPREKLTYNATNGPDVAFLVPGAAL